MTEHEKPAYQKYIDLLKSKDPSIDHTGGVVLRLMREEVEPQIKRMTKPQLIEAFAEAIYAIYHHERWESVLDSTIEHYKDGSLTWEMTAELLKKELEVAPGKIKSESAKHAADIRHGKTKNEREEKKLKIVKIWGSGKFSTRDLCAEEEYSALGFSSRGEACKALRNTPDPSPWPAKKKS
ncbi:hypothetical protein Nit79A3_1832 [Nitrosomonas sp. Is79A3]|uniref:hypothetical protein n=1 Tax=Nitrosomonas sp. (strain Is79A3) TaxID=261292 RepID=UPI000215CB72